MLTILSTLVIPPKEPKTSKRPVLQNPNHGLSLNDLANQTKETGNTNHQNLAASQLFNRILNIQDDR